MARSAKRSTKRSAATPAPEQGASTVKARTSKSWPQWFALLDKAGAEKLSHQRIVALLRTRYPKLGSWWQQMVTVAYEKARGKRGDYQRPQGYEITVSRTLPVSAAAVFRAWTNARLRVRWLRAPGLTITKATPGKSVRIAWSEDGTRVAVGFFAKGPDRCMVAVAHMKLPTSKAAAARKKYWAQALQKLMDTCPAR